MNHASEVQLLLDLLKLEHKYGHHTFKKLSVLLQDPLFLKELQALVTTGESVANIIKSFPNTNREKTVPISNIITEIRQTDPEKATIIQNIYEGILAKRYLPSLRDIRAFASELGLDTITATSRDKASMQLIRALLPLSRECLSSYANKISNIEVESVDQVSSLEGWSNIILRK